jgi:hypothetical protein
MALKSEPNPSLCGITSKTNFAGHSKITKIASNLNWKDFLAKPLV